MLNAEAADAVVLAARLEGRVVGVVNFGFF